jgi:hypothetical protein
MPDADKIGKLSRRWSKMFLKVCEGHFDSSSLANDAMDPLRKDIEDYGNLPVRFLKEASNRLEGIRNNPLFLPVYDWSDEDRFIRDLKFAYMQKNRANQRGINFAISAYKFLIHKFRNGENIQGDLDEVLIRSYVHQIYNGNFDDLAHLTLENHMDLNQDEINQRLNEMSNFVEEEIDFLASQITRKGSVKRLRSSSRIRSKAISIADDVFSLGNNK